MATDNFEGLGDETLRNAQGIRNSIDDIQDSTTRMSRALGESTKRYSEQFKVIRDSANKVADIQNNALKTSKATGKALEEQAKQLSLVRSLNAQIDDLYIRSTRETGATADLLKRQALNLAEARNNAKDLASTYGNIARDASKLDGKTKFFSKLAEIAKSVPVLNKLASPFEKAAIAARTIAIEQAKVANIVGKEDKTGRMRYYDTSTGKAKRISDEQGEAAMAIKKQSPAAAGVKAMGGEMLAAQGGWVGIATMVGKFLLDIFLGVNRQVVEISKNLNVSTEYAGKMRDHYNDIATAGNSIAMTTQTVIDAQIALVESLGSYSKLQDTTLRNQVFFTKNLGMSADSAADLNLMFEAQGQNAEQVTDSINKTNNAAAATTGRIVPFNKLMSSVAKTSKEIAGYFGFNAKAIAEGVRQVSKFGLELSNAATISKTLLDFESSIGNELTLELLTGKEFNLEKARTKALTGDIAGATADVMSQMQNLTEEQRKNPLIMESMAAMSGLTADQINRAYLVNKKLNKEGQDYVKSLQDQGKEKEANQAIDAALRGQSIQEIKNTINAQDAFGAALEKIKDKLSSLVDNGILDKFTQILTAFVNTVSKSGFTGLFTGDFSKNLEEAKAADITAAVAPKGASAQQQRAIAKLQERSQLPTEAVSGWSLRSLSTGVVSEEEASQNTKTVKEAENTIKSLTSGQVAMSKGGDVIGNTKEGGNAAYWDKMMTIWSEMNGHLKEAKHTSIHIGGTAVSEAIGIHTNQLGSK